MIIITAIVGILVGGGIAWVIASKNNSSKAEEIIRSAENKAREIETNANKKRYELKMMVV